MRLGELLGSDVVDAAGASIGRVHEVRLVKDGPPQGLFGRALRLDALVIGRAGIAARLGYRHGRLDRPWLVAAIVRRLVRSTVIVPWSAVASIGEGTVVLSLDRDQIGHRPHDRTVR